LGPMLPGTRAWIEQHYREAGLALPEFRWVQRHDPRAAADPESGALLLEDRELRQFLLLLELAGVEAPEAMAARVRKDLEAAWALRSACLPGEGPGLPGGEAAWHVRIHWLGAHGQAGAWRAAILHARQSGSMLDEIPVDAAFPGEGEPLARCLDRAGFPGLLLTTRGVFRKDARGAELWASADQRVGVARAGLEAAFPTRRAREIARELVALAQAEAPAAPPPGPVQRMRRLAVREVRGVRSLTVEPWPGQRPVQAWVLSGPNGSGKSSLAEAVSLKAFGASAGLCAYLRDPDVSKGRNPAGYLAHYVAPLGGGAPGCGFAGEATPFTLAPDLPSALEALDEADGTLAAQGGPAGFLDIPGDGLGARMARSFSALATRLGAHVEAGRQAAAEARTALARRHGISAGTRLLATFQDRIARNLLAAALPPLPQPAAEFLACRAALPGGEGAAALLEAWNPGRRLDGTVAFILLKDHRDAPDLEAALRPLFEEQEAVGRTLAAQLAGFRAQVEGLPAPPPGLASQAAFWAEWLGREPGPPAAPAPEAASPELAPLLAERAAVVEEGKRTRPLHDHLEATLAFLRGHWRDHAQDCPTCGSRLQAPVEATVAGLLATEQARLAGQRERYAALTARIRELEQRPTDPTGQACPVSAETRRYLQTSVTTLLGPEPAEALLRVPATRAALVKLLGWVENPAPADVIAPAAGAAACAQAIAAAWREAAEALAEPDAWDLVAKELTRRLAEVVARHLPATLEALWRELAACLSPAPWLLPAPPRFQARTLRGANRVEVVMETGDGEPRLARHLLNDAQRNTLGLAWSFCQHLARARFRHAWMLLDDPAQDMDQPAFRALCRFLAALLGLYEAAGLPFTLILLLNQEDRAMDAARETGQGLILLGWTGRQEDATLRRIELFGEGVRSPQPADLFAQSAS